MTAAAPVAVVSLYLLRYHFRTYLGLGLVVAVTTAVGSAELLLVSALRSGNVTLTGAASDQERQALQVQLAELGTLLSIILGLTACIAVALVNSAAGAVVATRSREMRLLRLNGASVGQVQLMIGLEVFLLVAIVGSAASVVGYAGVPLLLWGYKALGSFGSQIELGHYLDLPVLLAFLGVQAVLVAAIASARVRRVQVVVGSGKTRTAKRIRHGVRLLLGIAPLALAAALLFSLTQETPQAGQLVLMLPVAVTMIVATLARYGLPLISWAIASLLKRFAPGTFTLLAARSWGDRDRLAALAMPLIVAVGLLGGFLFSSAADSRVQIDHLNRQYRFETLITLDSNTAAQKLLKQLDADGAPQSVIVGELTDYTIDGAKLSVLPVSNPDTYLGLFGGQVTHTIPDGAGSNKPHAISSTSLAKAGESISAAPGFEFYVQSTAKELPYDACIVPISSVPPATINNSSFWRLYTTVPTDQLSDQAKKDTAGAQIDTKQAVLTRSWQQRLQTSFKSNVSIFGTIYVMALVALIQVTWLTTTKRKREFGLLRRAGLPRSAIVVSVVVESVLVAIGAFAMLMASFVLIAAKFSHDLNTDILGSITDTTPIVAAVHAAVSAILIALTLAAALHTTRQSGRR